MNAIVKCVILVCADVMTDQGPGPWDRVAYQECVTLPREKKKTYEIRI